MSSRAATVMRDPRNLRDLIGAGGRPNSIYGRSLVVHPPAKAGESALFEAMLVAFGKRRSMGGWPKRGRQLELAVSLWLHAHSEIDWIVVRSAEGLRAEAVEAAGKLAEQLNRRLALVDSRQPGPGLQEVGHGLELQVDEGHVAACICGNDRSEDSVSLDACSGVPFPALSDHPAPHFLDRNLVEFPSEVQVLVASAFNLGRAVMRDARAHSAATVLGRARYLVFTSGSRWEGVARLRGAQLELLTNRVWLSVPDVHSPAWEFRPSLDREAVDRLLGYVDPTRPLLGALSALTGLDAEDLRPDRVELARGGHVVTLLGSLRLSIPHPLNYLVRACEEQSVDERASWVDGNEHAATVRAQVVRIQGEVARCLTYTSWTRQAGFSVTRLPRSA